MAPDHDRAQPLQLRCTVAAGLRLGWEIVNVSDRAVHLLDGTRFPYVLREPDGVLTVLRGVNAPHPDIDYVLIEIPTTRPFQPGERFVDELALSPLFLTDHYQFDPLPIELRGRITIRYRVAWGETPILPADRAELSITGLLAWQHWAEAAPLQIDLA